MTHCINGTDCHSMVESNHRIANHLALLASYVSLRRLEFAKLAETPEGHEVLRLLDGVGAQVGAVAALHRMLTTSDAASSGDIGAHLGRICDAFRTGPVCGSTIEYARSAGCILPASHILPVSQIVSEVVTNALKYGHKPGCSGSIRVGCLRGVDNRILISVDDDGNGRWPGLAATKPNGIGFAMVAALVRQVNGTLEYRPSDRGLSFRLSLAAAVPVHVAPPAFLRQYACVSA
jgi:two-component sensor histidine kinase